MHYQGTTSIDDIIGACTLSIKRVLNTETRWKGLRYCEWYFHVLVETVLMPFFLITQEISCFLDSQGPSFQQWAHAIDLCNDPPIVYMRVAAEKGLGY